MSDHWICLVPKNPDYIPPGESIIEAENLFRIIAPESETISFSIDSSVLFRDCGGNLSSIHCPKCGALLPLEWWQSRMDEDANGAGFSLKPLTLICCLHSATLNDLKYDFDQAFSRFILEAMNPNIGKLACEQVKMFEKILGINLTVIYQHI